MKPLILAVALLLVGCSVVTKPTGVITIPRADFVNAYALAKTIYLRADAKVEALCRAELMGPQRCEAAAETRQAAKRLDLEIEKKLAVPESEINWAVILKMLEFAAGVVL